MTEFLLSTCRYFLDGSIYIDEMAPFMNKISVFLVRAVSLLSLSVFPSPHGCVAFYEHVSWNSETRIMLWEYQYFYRKLWLPWSRRLFGQKMHFIHHSVLCLETWTMVPGSRHNIITPYVDKVSIVHEKVAENYKYIIFLSIFLLCSLFLCYIIQL